MVGMVGPADLQAGLIGPADDPAFQVPKTLAPQGGVLQKLLANVFPTPGGGLLDPQEAEQLRRQQMLTQAAALLSASRGTQGLAGVGQALLQGSQVNQQRLQQAKSAALQKQQNDLLQRRVDMGAPRSAANIQELDEARKKGFKGNIQDWLIFKEQLARGRLKPVKTMDSQGRPIDLLVDQNGNSWDISGNRVGGPVKVPESTETGLSEDMTFQPRVGSSMPGVGVGPTPEERSRQTAAGTERAGKESQLPIVEQRVKETVDLVDQLLAHPSLPAIVGPIDARTPTFLPGSKAAETLLNQIKSRSFLEARQLLKGQGQISNFESERAEGALLRAERAVSLGEFKQAMTDFKQALQAALEAADPDADEFAGFSIQR